jgi:polyvinyl alcohol dehydrogenase (cytochrome)
MLRSPRKRTPFVFLCVLSGAMAVVAAGPEWTMIGHDPANTRNADSSIGVANVSRLKPKWVAATAGDVSATPAVAGGAVYFGDFGGTLWKLDAKTGAVIWSHSVAEYTGIAGDFARTSPSLSGDTLAR